MSKKHLYNSLDGLVNKCLRGLITYNPALALDEQNRVVYNTEYDKSTVSIISGGGSGHEPAWSGYVGTNLLAASVAGDVFASPSTRQIMAGMDAVPSDKGTILVVTNYTGDCLHFGLAAQKANAKGQKCKMIICGDDVSLGKNGSLVGRRGLAGQLGVLKVMGGASGAGGSLDQVYDLGMAFSQQIVSMAVTLDHCHVPGRAEHAHSGPDELEIGTGPHNEPGYKKLSPIPSPEDLAKTILKYLVDQSDPLRGYVNFNKGDETIILISNFGGMSFLEIGAFLNELLDQLDEDWGIQPVRVVSGFLETSLNAPAFSVSIVNVTETSKNCSYSADDIKGFFDARTNTHWESMSGSQARRRTRKEQLVQPPPAPRHAIDDATDLKVEPAQLDRMIRTACKNLIEAEPDLTRWDTIMGDGDCGESLKQGATYLLKALDDKVAESGSVGTVLQELEEILEGKMGGTLGGILGIFVVSLRAALADNFAITKEENGIPKLWAKATRVALDNLSQFTPAKVGDRTVMDTLIPFAEGLAANGKFDEGVDAAVAGAEKTKTLKPRLGRATYVGAGQDANQEMPPDPGAWGAMVVIKALQAGL
ncbi:hypothetical protein NPX13_g9801 [Xylaria arbuscula]|uniref:Dihydroxyacetone kinase n=1 Tax=Xylaria arbuscula TaxID=114810 RepID=A0A9W8N608_9PEZI|nr:hypothetical protein NPX13_g9801 [Xylaria arbuscula]